STTRLRPTQRSPCPRALVDRRRARPREGLMVRVIIAAIIAMVIAIVVGPRFIRFLRRNEFGQHVREELLEHHVAKQGTPVLGGLLIMMAMSIAFLAMSEFTIPAFT